MSGGPVLKTSACTYCDQSVDFPASALWAHPHVLVLVDEAAV